MNPHFFSNRTLGGAAVLALLAAAGPAQAQSWGALSFDEATFNYGFRIGAGSAQEANDNALGWCQRSGGTNCQVSYTFSGPSCLTLAVSENHKYWFRHFAQGSEDQIVRFTISDSVQRCTAAGGYRCAPQVTMCADQQVAWRAANQLAVSQAVVGYAAAHAGSQVGDGECWTLVNEALRAAGAMAPGTQGFDAYVFGQEVYRDFQPGDVIQWEGVHLQSGNSAYDFPHHTSIIASASGNVVNVYHQNINGDRRVRFETYDLAQKTQGLLRVYRPIPR